MNDYPDHNLERQYSDCQLLDRLIVEICPLCFKTDAFEPGKIKHDQSMHGWERQRLLKLQTQELTQKKDRTKANEFYRDMKILKSLGAKRRN